MRRKISKKVFVKKFFIKRPLEKSLFITGHTTVKISLEKLDFLGRIRGKMFTMSSWDRHRAQFLEKIQQHRLWRQSWDLEKKIICADRVSIGLRYDAYLKKEYANIGGDMPLWLKIYAIFWDCYRARFLEKRSKAQKHLQFDAMLRCEFFTAKRARWWSRILFFF